MDPPIRAGGAAGRGGPPPPRRTPQIATDPPHTPPYRPVRPGERAGGVDEGSHGSTTTPGVLARGSFIIIIIGVVQTTETISFQTLL